jgi:hypothetical protein
MKKALVGVGVLWFLLILVTATLAIVDDRKRTSCDKLAISSSLDKLNGMDSQKSYALHFPVR